MPKYLERAAVIQLEDLPNIGKAGAADLRRIGIQSPSQLVGQSPLQMYDALCVKTGARHDPCVIDVFMSAVRYMEGAEPLPWWSYTAERKRLLKSG
ncbi:MAG: Mitomycin resistance protein [Collimonas fungivorans]|uniref:helix-hairpin-helix domain-containing protein n=1 Tax=Collimonas fungivorans TaxID=158899 RepID=UPI0026EF75EA|nr:helix-hairpin-helix domain-containing protein [Collimonas fungivorans]MDB5766649.1 Mitomycin resistance protein [Collimonas fungivorans]